MTADAVEQAAQVLAAVTKGRCTGCLRFSATEHDWETTKSGERPDLCWETSPESCPWEPQVDIHHLAADALNQANLLATTQGAGDREWVCPTTCQYADEVGMPGAASPPCPGGYCHHYAPVDHQAPTS